MRDQQQHLLTNIWRKELITTLQLFVLSLLLKFNTNGYGTWILVIHITYTN